MSRATTSLGLLVTTLLCLGMTCAQPPPVELATLPGPTGSEPISYVEQVKPVLENRCVVCHGCYDAPCQLLFSSYEGLDRGATKQPVYQSSRLRAAPLTRLHVDAQSTDEWRERGFFSVSEESDSVGYGSLLLNMLALGRAQPVTSDARLPESFPLDINRELSCPTASRIRRVRAETPDGRHALRDGAPDGPGNWRAGRMGPTGGAATSLLRPPPEICGRTGRALGEVPQWILSQGAHHIALPLRTLALRPSLLRRPFERALLPHRSLDRRHRELQRPRGSRREDPTTTRVSKNFWYRLVPIESTIVHKTHIVYPLGEARKCVGFQNSSSSRTWEPTKLPEYDANAGSNPFATFAEIPARSRYQFLLDDAQYFVMTFIRGPVCRGQIAVSVIEDHFFVAFLDPDSRPICREQSIFREDHGSIEPSRRERKRPSRSVASGSSTISPNAATSQPARNSTTSRIPTASAPRSTSSGMATETTATHSSRYFGISTTPRSSRDSWVRSRRPLG